MSLNATIIGTPGDYARRRGLLRAVVPLLFLTLCLGIVLGSILADFFNYKLFLLLGFCVVLGFVLYLKALPTLARSFLKGARGEEAVAAELSKLPFGWYVFHGLILKNKNDVDHLVIGPAGIFVIETKSWKGVITMVSNQAYVDGAPVKRQPLMQIRSIAETIKKELDDSFSLQPIVCFNGFFEVGNVQIDEVKYCSVSHLLENLQIKNRVLTDTEIASVVNIFSQCEMKVI